MPSTDSKAGVGAAVNHFLLTIHCRGRYFETDFRIKELCLGSAACFNLSLYLELGMS